MHLNIRGRCWRFLRRRLRTDFGRCYHPRALAKQIIVASHLTGEQELEVTLHELLHAAYWDLSEEAVTEGGQDIARALWRLGYRRDPENAK